MRNASKVFASLLAVSVLGVSCSDDTGSGSTDPPVTAEPSTPDTEPDSTTGPGSTTGSDSTGAPDSTAPDGAGFQEGDCSAQPAGVPLRCGMVEVPLDYDEPDGPTIQIAVAVVAAATPDPDAVPVMMLGGGPGEHTLEPIIQAIDADVPLLDIAETRDLVIIDQRGVGLSEPALDCPEFFDSLAKITQTAEIAGAATAGITACHDRLLAEGVDLSAFDTAANVQDLDAVRAALGYERISLFGTSYGARLALQAAREFPDTIESVALSSPIPAEQNFIVDAATSFDAAVQAVGTACAADPACNAAYPDVTGRIVQSLNQLQQTPASVQVTDPSTGQTTAVPIDGATAATSLFGLFYLPDGPASVPYMSSLLASGDLSSLAAPTGLSEVQVSTGMQLSFFCAEEAVQATPDEFDPGTLGPGSLLIDFAPIVGPMLWDLCKIWDVEPGDPATFEPVVTDVPLLVVTGQFDQITPPAYGDEVAAGASTAWLLEVPGAGHSPLLAAGPCGIALLDAFLAAPAQQPDPGCSPAAQPFYTPEDIAELEAAAAASTSVPQ